MCGIAGHIDFGRRPEIQGVEELVRGMRHRGPDDAGVWVSPDKACALGHARLSIIDLSPLGHQPMLDSTTGNCIVFNGEIYNFQELRKECEAGGDQFRSHSDTEVILALYRRYGFDCLPRLRGMFAFALWDARSRVLFVARDRVGKKPLNYALTTEGLIFCSEIDPLVRHSAVSAEMDADALEMFLQLQYIPSPRSIYKHIRKLPPAHYAVFHKDGFRVKQYWSVDYTAKKALSEQEALDGLEDKLTEAVRLRTIADVPLGALLSGGVDSSVVVALMAKVSGDTVRTYSIGFKEEAFNELPFAQQASEICGTIHQPDIVGGDVEHLLPEIVRHYGEPYADCSALPSFLVSRAARNHVTVAMNGDGGDELLGGYPRYWLSPAKLKVSSLIPPIISPSRRAALAAGVAEGRGLPQRVAWKLLTEFMWPELRSLNLYRDYWNDKERAQLLGASSRSGVLPQWRSEWLMRAIENSENPVDTMLWFDNRTYLEGDLLVKMDIASMHCGLETRSPLLDHEVIEYCAALPVEYKVNNGVGKYLLKKLAERYFPKEFVYRKKMGFSIPVADWLAGPLRQVLEDTLRDKNAMEPLAMPVVENYLNQFLAGRREFSAKLWTLLMFGLWKQYATE